MRELNQARVTPSPPGPKALSGPNPVGGGEMRLGPPPPDESTPIDRAFFVRSNENLYSLFIGVPEQAAKSDESTDHDRI
jgi:hypothetical protein